MGDIQEANKLNKEILKECNNENLVSRANEAFLFLHENNLDKAFAIADSLQELKRKPGFDDQKIEAVFEQGFYYHKFAGAANNLSAIDILSFLHELRPNNDSIALMLARVYGRCTHPRTFAQDTTRIKTREFTLKAACLLNTRVTTPNVSRSIKVMALVELAYLKRIGESSNYVTRVFSVDEWKKFTGQDDVLSLCKRAVELGSERPSVKATVLKLAGQMVKNKDEDLGEKWLKESIEIQTSSKAYHHLALLYKKKANRPEHRGAAGGGVAHLKKKARLGSDLDDRLGSLTAAVTHNMKQFDESNEDAQQSCYFYKEAVKVDNGFNKDVLCEYAEMLAQTGNFDEAIEKCERALDQSSLSDAKVNAYQTLGLCLGIKAGEETQKSKKMELVSRAEFMLLQAIRGAAVQAAKVPELSDNVNGMWEAISHQKQKFNVSGDWYSKERLSTLCRFLSQNRILPAVSSVLSLSESAWSDDSASFEAFKKLISQGDLDGALLFLDMIPLRPDANHPNWYQSNVRSIKKIADGAVTKEVQNNPDVLRDIRALLDI